MPLPQLLIQRVIDSGQYDEMMYEQVYYFQKLTDLYKQFTSYEIAPIQRALEQRVIPTLLSKGHFETRLFLEANKSDEYLYNFLVLIARMDTYIDTKAYNKNLWNEYPDKRTLSQPMTPMRFAILYFIYLKISPDKLPDNHIFITCLRYLQSPLQHTAIMSENHKLQVRSWLGLPTDEDFFVSIRNWFHSNIKYKVQNPQNEPLLWSMVMYNPIIKPEWNNLSSLPETDIIRLKKSLIAFDNDDAVVCFFDMIASFIEKFEIEVNDKRLKLTNEPSKQYPQRIMAIIGANGRSLQLFKENNECYMRIILLVKDIPKDERVFNQVPFTNENIANISVPVPLVWEYNLLDKWLRACSAYLNVESSIA